MNTPKIDRRKFLKWVGAATALTLPALLGYNFWRSTQIDSFPNLSPYAVTDIEPSPSLVAPLLLLLNEQSDNPFGPYLAEILRAEGLNCFQTATLAVVDSTLLAQFDLVLLAEGTLDNAQAELLTGYVAQGGRLIAMRPDARLVALFGLERLTGSVESGYLQVNASQPVGRGINSRALQFHGSADSYRLAGAQAVAWLSDASDTPSESPAVTLYAYGQGQAVLWAFDLARSVAYIRQGNPAWANQERDELDGVRACDMFKDWIDLERVTIPQADEQQRLLVNLLTVLSQSARPLPRLWYFPSSAPAMLIATGDSHMNIASPIEFVLAQVEKRGGHMSVYYTPPATDRWRSLARKARWWLTDLPVVGQTLANSSTLPTPSLIADWRNRGHEFTFHPYVEEGVEAGYRRYWQEFIAFDYGPISPTVRTHRILWQGWVETARVQAAYNLRMNVDYYHIGSVFQKPDDEWTSGHFTGSGLPMKFVDEQGRILNVFQQLTQLVDEHLLEGLGGPANLRAEAALEVSQTVLRRSLTEAPAAITAQFHIDPIALSGLPISGFPATEALRWLEGTLDFAVAQGIPIWSAEKWLYFTEARQATNFDQFDWQAETQRLSFRVKAPVMPGAELAVMIPGEHNQAQLVKLTIDEQPVIPQQRQVGGINYGWVTVASGPHQIVAIYA